MADSYPNGWKTLWEKEKLMSNFSFSHSVFKRLVSQERQKVPLCGNGLMWKGYLKSLPNDKILVLSKFKAFADDKFNAA